MSAVPSLHAMHGAAQAPVRSISNVFTNEIANGLSATPKQVALAWLLRRSNNILLIPGTARLPHLHENMASARLELPQSALERLGELAVK